MRPILVVFALLALGCGGPSTSPPRVAASPNNGPHLGETPETGDDDRPGSGDPAREPPPRPTLPDGWHSAPGPPRSGCLAHMPCIDAYLALPAALGRAPITTRATLDPVLAALLRDSSPDAPAEAPVVPLAELQVLVAAGLALDGLLPTIDPRVIEVDRVDAGGVPVRRLLLEDPLLGSLDAISAAPADPRGAVLMLHGHGESEDDMLIERRGLALAEAGWLVLVPRIRAYQDGASESEAAWVLLEHGMTLMGVEVAEALRWARWLRRQSRGPIAVVGHSGGAAIALFATIVDPTVSGLVVDGTPQLTNWSADGIADETLPALVPHRWALTTLERPFVRTVSLSDELGPLVPMGELLAALEPRTGRL